MDTINDKFLERKKVSFTLKHKYGPTHKRVKSLSARIHTLSSESKLSYPSGDSYMFRISRQSHSNKTKSLKKRSCNVNRTWGMSPLK